MNIGGHLDWCLLTRFVSSTYKGECEFIHFLPSQLQLLLSRNNLLHLLSFLIPVLFQFFT